jgi:hypothetical protein
MTKSPSAPLSRRSLLSRGVALSATATVAPILGGAHAPAGAATSSTLPTVTPVWSETLRRSYGVATHPNMRRSVYGQVDAWTGYVGRLNAGYIRGKYSPNLRETLQTVARCRTFGLKWLMTLIPEDWSMSTAELKASLAHIRDHAADVCIGIEGINEPNHNRDGSRVRSDWATVTVTYQRVIREFVAATPALSHVSVVGPSLQLAGGDQFDDFLALQAAGVEKYMDYAGVHSYPGGFRPHNMVDVRLGWAKDAWGAKPAWVSETGYNNAMASPLRGPRPTPVDVSATYGPRSVLEYFSRGARSARYELLDDPNPANNDPESNYGLVKCPSQNPSTWSVKPEYTLMQSFLASLRDSASSYRPAGVPLRVQAPTGVKTLVVGKSNGTASLLTYLNASIYDPVKRTRLTVAPVDVTVTDRVGTRVVKVGPSVQAISLR